MALARDVLVVVVASGCWSSPPPATPSTPTPVAASRVLDAAVVVDAMPAVATNDHTGFDLYVTPANVPSWKLDGEAFDERLPSRIRGIVPGPHQIEIEAPAGYANKTQEVDVELDKAPKIEIVLDPLSK